MLAAAGVAKLCSPAAARDGLRVLAPARVAAWGPAPRLLATVELGLAVGLVLPGATRTAAAGASAVLLVLFAVALGRAAAGGSEAGCACFGAWSAEPIGWWSVGRAVVLASLAALHVVLALTVGDGGGDGDGGGGGVDSTATGLVGAVAIVALVGWGTSLAAGRAARTPRSVGDPDPADGVPAAARVPDLTGAAVPDVEVVLPDGQVRALARLRGDGALLVVVVSLACASCRALLDELPAWQHDLGEAVRVVAVTSSDLDAVVTAHPGVAPLLALGARGVRTALGVPGTPAAVLVGADGRVATRTALGEDEVLGLLAGTVDAVQAGHRDVARTTVGSGHSPLEDAVTGE